MHYIFQDDISSSSEEACWVKCKKSCIPIPSVNTSGSFRSGEVQELYYLKTQTLACRLAIYTDNNKEEREGRGKNTNPGGNLELPLQEAVLTREEPNDSWFLSFSDLHVTSAYRSSAEELKVPSLSLSSKQPCEVSDAEKSAQL